MNKNRQKPSKSGRKKEPGLVSKTFKYIVAPIKLLAIPATWLFVKIFPASAVYGLLKNVDDVAKSFTDKGGILRDGKVSAIEELRDKNLRLSDKLCINAHNWAIGLAVAEGGVTGAAGIGGIAVDLPAIIVLAFRTIHKIGMCYGYELGEERDSQFVYSIFAASTADSKEEKSKAILSATTALRKIESKVVEDVIEEELAEMTIGRQVAKGGVVAAVSKGGAFTAVKGGSRT